MSDIKTTIKQIRASLKITQNDLAEILGVHRTTVTNYEAGLIKPSCDVLLKIQELEYHQKEPQQ